MDDHKAYAELTEPERERYFKLMALHNDNRRPYDTIKWETLKFAQVIFGALILATFAALGAFKDKLAITEIRWAIGSLAIAGGIALIVGLVNFIRESYLLFLEEGSMFRIAHFLFNQPIKEQSTQHLSGSPSLLHPKWFAANADLKESTPITCWAARKTLSHPFTVPMSYLLVAFAILAIYFGVRIIAKGNTW